MARWNRSSWHRRSFGKERDPDVDGCDAKCDRRHDGIRLSVDTVNINLNPDIVSLISRLVSPLGKTGSGIVHQAKSARVVRNASTMIDLDMPDSAPAVNLPNGPVPVSALVVHSAQVVGELLLWIRNGRVIGLEQAWYTDDPPLTWPSPSQVRISSIPSYPR